MLEDMQITNGTLALRARGGSPRDLSVGVVGERAPVPCAPAAPGNRDLRRPPPRQAEPRGPHSESSALKLVPTRAMVWTGSARPSIAVTTNMAKKPLPRGGSQGILVVLRVETATGVGG